MRGLTSAAGGSGCLRNRREVGHYIPKINERSHPLAADQPTAVQINDVEIDHRGLAYASDRAGSGLFILEYTGPPAGFAVPL